MTAAFMPCPTCPLCESPPLFVLVGDIQAFCSNPDCDLICWNPSVSLDENLTNAGNADVTLDGNPIT